jgi:hypothetical protein
MSKNNVHPDHYKVGGRDRQDDAAAARFARSVAAKAASQQRPDRMRKGPYFQRAEPAAPAVAAGLPATPAPKKSSPRAGAAKKSAARKASPPRKTAARSRKSAASLARPTKKR